ncbi:MAG: PD-(D/E)XK nuclease family protein [Blastocatellia bacterium]
MKVLTGRPNTGKSQHVISRAAEALVKGRGRVRLVVPSANAAIVMHDRLRACEQLRSINRPEQVVITFPGLYTSVLAAAGEQPVWLSPVERERLIRHAVNELAEARRLSYYAETAATPGLISAVAGFIDEMCRSGTSPEQFARVASTRSGKDRDLALIYEAYLAALDQAGAVDPESAGLRALHALEGSGTGLEPPSNGRPRPDFFRENTFSFIAADGFDFYTPVQVRLLSALARSGAEVIATLTYEEGRAVHLWQERTAERLKSAGAEVIIFSRGPESGIERAAGRLMADAGPTAREDNSDSIQIISVPDRAAEVRAVAREVKRLVIEDGCSVNDISIVCRSLSQYSHHLERVFRECSIPLAIECPLTLGENQLVVAVERMLSLHANSFPRRALIDCLRSPYFDLSCYGLDEQAVDLLDRISILGNVTRGPEQWAEVIAARQSRAWKHRRHDEEQDVETDEDRAAWYASLDAGLRNLFGDLTPVRAATRSDHARWIRGLLERLCVRRRAAESESSSRDLPAFEALEALIGVAGSDAGIPSRPGMSDPDGRGMSWFHFFKELDRAIAGASFPREKASKPALVAQEAHGLWPRRFRAVFILGLIEGEFPARVAETAPYTLVERDELRASGVDLTETPADAGADLTQFYKAMNCARQRLYLSHARADVGGEELLPSYLLEEVAAVASPREVRIAQPAAAGALTSLRYAASLEELASATAHAMREYFAGGGRPLVSPDEEARAAGALLDSMLPSWRATKRGARLEYGRMNSRGLKNNDGLMRDPRLVNRLKDLFGPEHLWSASQVNDFGTCPFRFFAKHVLKLAPAGEPFEGFGPNHLGDAYHQILESLHKRLLADEIQITAGTAREATTFAEQVAEEVLETMASKGSVRKGPTWEFDKSEIKKRVVMLLQAEAEWNGERPARPIRFETRFGEGGNPPLVIECDGGPIKLRGVIDRIDERDDGLVVIDYKTGRTPIRHAEALDGRNLQLPIYAMAAGLAIGNGAKVASAYYLHIHSRKKGSEFPHKEDERLSLDGVIARTEERIRDYVRRARGGDFPVSPNDDRCPTYCEFDVMCRIQSVGPAAAESD